MFDPSTDLGRLLQAAVKLAGEQRWQDVSLDAIGREAGLNLAAVRKVAKSKQHLLGSLTRAIDDEVMRRVGAGRAAAEGHRDRLFDVMMTRFEVMAPYRRALRSISDDLRGSPTGIPLRSVLNSNYWMLAAAGIGGEGLRGTARVAGLAALSAQVFDIWLDDEDPGLSKTMAALDKRLRRAERTVGSVEDTVATAKRIACSFIPGRRNRPTDARAGGSSEPPSNGGAASMGGNGTTGSAY